ncbi:MAG: hypothetical protein HFE49_06775 [Clostridia bacterium]|nr:hypothetical protein [Clostridia bacterium]
MITKQLFDIINNISDDLITEAANPHKRIKRIRISKVILIAAVMVTLLGFTAWAANMVIVSRTGHSSNIPDYYTVPTQATLLKDIGISMNVIDKFSNGYIFREASVGDNADYGENGQCVEKFKSLICKYVFEDKDISVHIDAAAAGTNLDDDKTAEVYKNTAIKYISYQNKIVPSDYKLTAEDEADKRSGRYVFSYGSDEVEIIDVQLIEFAYQGLNYSMCTFNNSLTRDALVQMAREFIDYQ